MIGGGGGEDLYLEYLYSKANSRSEANTVAPNKVGEGTMRLAKIKFFIKKKVNKWILRMC